MRAFVIDYLAVFGEVDALTTARTRDPSLAVHAACVFDLRAGVQVVFVFAGRTAFWTGDFVKVDLAHCVSVLLHSILLSISL